MFKRVDVEETDELQGFEYENQCGDKERVVLEFDGVRLTERDDGPLYIVFYEDIPNLIKALQAAFVHYTGNPQ